VSKTHYEDVSLEEAVAQSDVVVVAAPAEPARRGVVVDITPAGKKKNTEMWPPFTRWLSRWVVREVLQEVLRDAQQLQVGDLVEVEAADADSQLELHKKYYVEKISKSPLYRRYTPPSDESAAPSRILLLRRHDGGLRFAVSGSIEIIERRGAVEALLQPTTTTTTTTKLPPKR
jgi:hypothetical protein